MQPTPKFADIQTKKDDNKFKVICRFNGTPSNDELITYLREIDTIYKQNLEFYIIYDASQIGFLTPTQIKEQVTFMRNHDADTKRLIKKCAIVITSTWARKALDGIFVLKPPACELKVVSSFKEAQEYLRK